MDKKKKRRQAIKSFITRKKDTLIFGFLVSEVICVLVYHKWLSLPLVFWGYVLAVLAGALLFFLHCIYLYKFDLKEQERLEKLSKKPGR